MDWVTLSFEIVNFLVLVWIMKRFLYQPVLQTIARRKAAIEQALAEARAKLADGAAMERQYRDRLGEWEKEKRALRAQAEEEVNAERSHRMAMLEDALGQERERQRVGGQQQMNELRGRVENEAALQGTQFAAQLLERAAGPELEARLVALALEDLARLPAQQLQEVRAACRGTEGKVTVTSAFPLPERARRELAEGCSAVAAVPLSPEFAEDPRLLAGVRVGIGPWVLHANLQDELKFFAEMARHGT